MDKKPREFINLGLLNGKVIYYSLEEERLFCYESKDNRYLLFIVAPIVTFFARELSNAFNHYLIGQITPFANILILIFLTLMLAFVMIKQINSSREKLEIRPFILSKSGLNSLKFKSWGTKAFEYIFGIAIFFVARSYISSSNFQLLLIYIFLLIVLIYIVYDNQPRKRKAVYEKLRQEFKP